MAFGGQRHQCSLARAYPHAQEKELKTMKLSNRKITSADYPYLVTNGFITFRKKPHLTVAKFLRHQKREEQTLSRYGYQVPLPGGPQVIRCKECNCCIVSGLSDGKTFRPFSHFCTNAGCSVSPEGTCRTGRNGWGPVVQVLNGAMR